LRSRDLAIGSGTFHHSASVLGGVGTLVVVLLWLRFSPTLRRADKLENAVE
jgi:hypothetical protein